MIQGMIQTVRQVNFNQGFLGIVLTQQRINPPGFTFSASSLDGFAHLHGALERHRPGVPLHELIEFHGAVVVGVQHLERRLRVLGLEVDAQLAGQVVQVRRVELAGAVAVEARERRGQLARLARGESGARGVEAIVVARLGQREHGAQAVDGALLVVARGGRERLPQRRLQVEHALRHAHGAGQLRRLVHHLQAGLRVFARRLAHSVQERLGVGAPDDGGGDGSAQQ
mmetsp:Transcript_2823/g.6325  ORF Transcript_2823/g.6325 Transcript_2823/m.6325 type:complete len:227 (+) Transcript_2823:100-780(+)